MLPGIRYFDFLVPDSFPLRCPKRCDAAHGSFSVLPLHVYFFLMPLQFFNFSLSLFAEVSEML